MGNALHFIEKIKRLEAHAIRICLNRRGVGYPLAPLTPRHVATVLTIYRCEPCSLAELADALAMSKPTTATLTNNLLAEGYIKKDTDPKDMRRNVFLLVPHIREAVEALDTELNRLFDTMALHVWGGDSTALSDNLQSYCEAISDILDKERLK